MPDGRELKQCAYCRADEEGELDGGAPLEEKGIELWLLVKFSNG